MEKITHKAITTLLKNSKAPAVTIYCPMHKSGAPPHMTEEKIRFKNLINKALEELKNSGVTPELESALGDMLDSSLHNQEFWESQSASLLICAQPGSIRLFKLPLDTEEYVAVDDSFHLAPVLSIVQEAVDFYVLSIAQHAPKLFRGDMYGLYPTKVELPETLEKALNIDEVNQKSEHARSASGPSLGPSGFHGRGGARDPREEDRARFLRMIDHIVCTSTNKSLPLVLAGIDAETAEFRHLSKYPAILQKTISGSYSGAKPQDLYQSAYSIVHEEIIATQQKEAVTEFESIKGATPERVATSKEAITEAAEQGRIDKLLISILRHTTDTVRDTREAMARITFPELKLSSSMNHLANKVWQTSGKIIGLDSSQMPDGSPMVARLRY